MTTKEFFVKTIESEIPRFERVLKALPQAPKDMRHHPKNQNAAEIATTMALETSVLPAFLKTGEMDFAAATHPKGHVHDAADMLVSYLKETADVARNMSEAEWDSDGSMMSGGKPTWTTPRGEMVWSMLFDLIHHRGQLSTHIRPHGGNVPSIYGPSGDSANS